MRSLLVVLAGLFSGCFAYAAVEPVLTDHSYGVVRFGERLTDAEAALGEKATIDEHNEGCRLADFKKYPAVTFMVEGTGKSQIITRADVRENMDVANPYGLKRGLSFEQARRRSPRVLIQRHHYDDQGHYLVYNSPDGRNAILAEESGGKLMELRAGVHPSVDYVEACE